MKDFAHLFRQLDTTTRINVRVDALVHYFTTAAPNDKLWALALLSHRRPRRAVKTSELREWSAEAANIPLWLLEESYHVVGDLAETLALVLPEPTESSTYSLSEWMEELLKLPHLDVADRKQVITRAWNKLHGAERFLFNKLITGAFRVGVSQKLVVRALSRVLNKPETELAHRLMGHWDPQTASFDSLLLTSRIEDDLSRPYPFYLAYPLEEAPDTLGPVTDWQAEYKWDGIRAQLLFRRGQIYIWSRGEELVTDRFPEFKTLLGYVPDGTVCDAEILAWQDERPLDFQVLQTRIGRKTVSKASLRSAPVIAMVYDLLEWQGEDLRQAPLQKRRNLLEQLLTNFAHGVWRLSPALSPRSWSEVATLRIDARNQHAEGLMLKRLSSAYGVGRKRGDWWKWKVDPLTVDAVMIYAMRGHGRRANLYTDYTFAVWDGEELVPFTKAYSGLTDAEIREVDRFVKKHTIERFGPVRSVEPTLVFELAFEGIARSTRHKSGIALRFPRIARWRKDKPAAEANTLKDLEALLDQNGSSVD